MKEVLVKDNLITGETIKGDWLDSNAVDDKVVDDKVVDDKIMDSGTAEVAQDAQSNIDTASDEMQRLAQSHQIGKQTKREAHLLTNLERQTALIKNAYQHYRERSGQDSFLPFEAEWLLDNYYLVQRVLRQIEEDMPVGYYRQLPKLVNGATGTTGTTGATGEFAGLPRVFAVAAKIVELSTASTTPTQLAEWLAAYQQVAPLTMGELWAFPTMLRMALIDALALAVALTTQQLSPVDNTPGTLVRLAHSVAPENIVAHAIPSLRILNALDWEDFFEQASYVEQTLRHDPTGIYASMDFETRNQYRDQVEVLARFGKIDEVEIARTAIQLAQRSLQDSALPARTNHVGYYLIDNGKADLEQALGIRQGWQKQASRWIGNHPTHFYLGLITAVAALLLVLLIGTMRSGGISLLVGVLILLVSSVPLITVASGLVNALLGYFLKPRRLPKLDFSNGIPDTQRSMVVIPALLSSEHEIDALLRQLEQQFLSNADANLGFALLTDFTDGTSESMPEDKALLTHAKAGIEDLNQRYQNSTGETLSGETLSGETLSGEMLSAETVAGEDYHLQPFYLFHRRRLWNPSEARWMGWERKRGKLHEFNQLLRGKEDTTYSACVGNMEFLPSVRSVITLDADTQLPFESARRLAATLAHPLNQALFDEKTMRVVAGYSVLQPRTEIKPTSANHSIFSQIFAGDTGFDLYTHAVSDVYQDLFGQGIYIGKGIYDVDAFEHSLADRVPENRLLSHDLFEGGHGRAALVSDIIVYEEYPSRYLVYTKRMHRWIRGDWQLLPWLANQVPHVQLGKAPNPLRTINRWQIFDNLRRSLLVPSLLLMLAVGWLIGEPAGWVSSFIWDLLAAGVLALPLLISALMWGINALRNGEGSGFVQTMRPGVMRWLLALAFLPYEAVLALDAIIRTLVRMLITRRQLLEWTPAAVSERLMRRDGSNLSTWQQMFAGPWVAISLAILITLLHPQALPAALPWLLAWLFSPQIAHWISQPHTHQPTPLSSEDQQWLRTLARRTWLYFEHFVGPDDNWLPPDHFQENPLGLVAHRTSPTNIGLGLLAALAAYDLGYDDLNSLLTRLQSSMSTLQKLEKYRGHFLNWYATRTLEPLPPRYVSMVDSGNLAASLWALRQGLEQIGNEPILRQQRWQGLIDNLAIFSEILDKLGRSAPEVAEVLHSQLKEVCGKVQTISETPCEWAALIEQVSKHEWPQLNQQMMKLIDNESLSIQPHTFRQLRVSIERVEHHLQGMRREMEWLTPWLLPLANPPALLSRGTAEGAELATRWQALQTSLCSPYGFQQIDAIYAGAIEMIDEIEQALAKTSAPQTEKTETELWCVDLRAQIDTARNRAHEMQTLNQQLSDECEQIVEEMDFGFLYDSHRHIFHIGFNVDAGVLDGNYYDLLASEARAGSLVAIAKGDVPAKHWLHLGRPLTQSNGRRTLLSWSGTMFEYLMPTLLTRTYPNTLMQQSLEGAIDAQIDEGRTHKLPWGVSEAGYYQFDANLFYQYRAFGTPMLGFKRGLADDYVVAPYATVLALPFRPQAVLQNLKTLQSLDLLGDYGFYEAIDYTEGRLPLGQQSAVVKSFMVHHQGMILLALLNYLDENRMVRRFHADPRIQSIELLLQEQIPYHAPLEQSSDQDSAVIPEEETQAAVEPWDTPLHTAYPRVHYLSNGRFSTLVSNSGSGFSRWQAFDLTRWRSDTTLDDWGHWFYLLDNESGESWSLTMQPGNDSVPSGSVERHIAFLPHKVEFHAFSRQIDSHMEVCVSPQDDVEVRRVQLVNRSDRPRKLTLISYGEVVLAAQNADRRHPAFNKLFIESKFRRDLNALVFHRRPRSSDETPVFFGYALIPPMGEAASGQFETDRRQFLGRGGTSKRPLLLTGKDVPGFSNSSGNTLDPIFSFGQTIEMEPGETLEYAFISTAGDDSATVEETIHRYHDWAMVHQLFEQSRKQSGVELHQLEMTSDDLGQIQHLLSLLLYPHPSLRARPDRLVENRLGQSGLWPFAISGDYPILLVEISDEDEIALVQELVQAHTYWRNRNLQIDLVILNNKESGYAQEIQGQLHRLLHRSNSELWLNQRGGIFILRRDTMNAASSTLLASAARIVLRGQDGNLRDQLGRIPASRPALPNFQPSLLLPPTPDPELRLDRPTDLQFDNGLGGFSADGKEYQIYLDAKQMTPAPWINVIANENFGFLVSESGMGSTWAVNSGENRLTPWRNDPLGDNQGEALYLRDEETAEVWSPTPLPAREDSAYLVRHGSGYSIFEHQSHALKQEVRYFVAGDAPIKIVTLRLENPGKRARRVTATYYAEWVLGVNRDEMQQFVIPEYENEHHALLARNPYNDEFGERIAFLTATQPPHGLTSDRTEFLGIHGQMARPAALGRIGLSNTVEAGSDPCAAYMIHVDLPPGESRELHFLLGQGANRAESIALIQRFQDATQVQEAWQHARGLWQDLLTTVQVETPEPAMDLLLNRWLLYQNLVCRVWGRSAFYQSSGAYGFRDQLQDVLALLHAKPELAREQILRAMRHQFESGDVLHWWHPPSGRGVRTRISDDLLWLPYVTAHYVLTTGDRSILAEESPFLVGQPLDKNEHERYGRYEESKQAYSLLEHCRRALKRGQTSGAHGLPLFGGGDWNDGMNRVGMNGKGESVWLGWFLIETLNRFGELYDQMGETDEAATLRHNAEQILQSLESNAWDGDWYLRGYYDDGSALGSAQSQECQIDAIAQSWAVLSAKGEISERAMQAMQAVRERLVQKDQRFIQLFTPPFDKTARDPGYIKGYPPGIRENGGQYTHAAIWTVWAFARMGDGDAAEELFRLLNPIEHADTPEKVEEYRVEPYVIAADVYSRPPHVGMGGWTWYTGSAGWMYRLGIEGILGLQKRGEQLLIDPCIPKAWSGFTITYRFGESAYRIEVTNPQHVSRGVKNVTVDGKIVACKHISLVDDGQTHLVRVELG